MKYTPVDNEFVIIAEKPAGAATVADAIPGNPKVSAVGGDQSMQLVRFASRSDPRQRVSLLKDALGPDFRILPALRDSDGALVLPTGRVQVRFKRELTEAELRHFAKRSHLLLVERNQMVPEQAVFEPEDVFGTFLPDVIDGADQDDEVRSAWPETKGRYKKSNRP